MTVPVPRRSHITGDATLRSTQAQTKRELVLNCAGNAFARHGYEGASMSDITREAGVSKATVYHYFASKAALFGAYVERECERSLLHSFDALPGPLGAALEEIGRRLIRLLISPSVLAIDRMVVSEAGSFPDLASTLYDSGPRRGIARMVVWLQGQASQGHLAMADPELAAEQFFALCQARVVMRSRLRLPEKPTAESIDRVLDGAVRVFLRAYAVDIEGSLAAWAGAAPTGSRLRHASV